MKVNMEISVDRQKERNSICRDGRWEEENKKQRREEVREGSERIQTLLVLLFFIMRNQMHDFSRS